MKKRVLANLLWGSFLLLSSCQGGNSSSVTTSSPEDSVSVSTPDVEYEVTPYSNPVTVISGNADYKGEIADPSIVKGEDGLFYIFATNRVMLVSEDGVNFTVATTSVIPQPTWGQDLFPRVTGFCLWAPDVEHIGDKWIYYYALSGPACAGIGYAVADSCAGPYTDMGKMFSVDEIGVRNAIDPMVYVTETGEVWMAFGSFQGLYMIQLAADGLGLYSPDSSTTGITYQEENKILIAGYPGNWDSSTYEGSYIIKHGDYYYYFGSAGTCCSGQDSTYYVKVGRSENLTGPYVDSTGTALTNSGSGKTYGEMVVWAGVGSDRDVIGPGHNSILVDDRGDAWIYYHAYDSDDAFRTRHLFMDKLEWTEDGWPYVENKKPSFHEEKDGPAWALA